MINYKELRIGNWIRQSKRNNGIDCIEEDLQVKNINSKGLNIASNECPIYYEWQWFESIPLTPEILEKCGFSKYNTVNLWIKGDFYLHRYLLPDNEFCFKYNDFKSSSIKYLHQLQNLYFAFTGKELEYTP